MQTTPRHWHEPSAPKLAIIIMSLGIISSAMHKNQRGGRIIAESTMAVAILAMGAKTSVDWCGY